MAVTPKGVATYQLTPSQVIKSQSAQWHEMAKQITNDIRVATPAFLTEDMDAATQTVTVQVALQEQVRTKTKPQWWDIPPIIMVPVIMPRGGGYSTTLPLKKNDEGLLIFCDTCFDLWWKNGQSGTVAQNTPNSGGLTQRQNEVRRHYIHDCGFLPGMWSQPNVLSNFSTDSLQVRDDDATTILDIPGVAGTASVDSAFSSVVIGAQEIDVDADSVALAAETGNVEVSGDLYANDNLYVNSGASGTFSTSTGQTVTVQNGIVIDIS